ncbi:MAG: ABC transporter permease, partial [Ruminiclostridium sp.]|nr:ABC transporter permease [Ruminiclostridium sp.]
EKEFENSGEAAIVTRIMADEDGSLAVRSTYPGGENGVPRSDCDMLSYQISDAVKKNKHTIIGVPHSEVETAMSKVSVSMVCAGEVPKSPIKEAVNIIVPMVSSIVLFIFIFSYSQLVAQAVAIEKSSRIVEYLLTSIKPLALIVGKVLAMCTLSLLQFIIIGVGGFMGFVISLPFGIMSRVGDITNTISNAVSGVASQAAAGVGGAAAGMAASEQIDVNGIISELGAAFEHVDGGLFLVMFLSFILGFLFYAGIAGLAGSSISKMEDLAPALQPLSLIGVLGFYLAYFPKITGEDNAFSLLSRYLPISSPFVLPADYIVGNVDFAGAMLAIAILAAFDIMIMILVAKVYESIILHTCNRLKLGDMLKMSKKTAAK